ncbi:MAG: signal peptidase I [Micrococcales bacterium]|nr:signal peptidase I [Micrococcales bacterium]
MNKHNLQQVYRMTDPWYRSPFGIAGAVLALAATVVVVVVVAIFVVPRLMGGSSMTVQSGSMRPAFSPGDVIVVSGVDQADVCASVGVGQVVTFMPDPNSPALVTHQVVAKKIGTFDDGTSCRLVTRGDANAAADEPVSPAQVRGVLVYVVPKLGWVRQWVSHHQGILAIGALVLLGLVVWSSLRPAKTRVVALRAPIDNTDALALKERELMMRETVARERENAIRKAELELRTAPNRWRL